MHYISETAVFVGLFPLHSLQGDSCSPGLFSLASMQGQVVEYSCGMALKGTHVSVSVPVAPSNGAFLRADAAPPPHNARSSWSHQYLAGERGR